MREVENELLNYRVLDPACGSGNFLYVAYRELRRLERQLDEKLGAKRMLEEKTAEEITALKRTYPDIGGTADYVSYWFRKAHDLLPAGGRAGLVGLRAGSHQPATRAQGAQRAAKPRPSFSTAPWLWRSAIIR